MTEVHLALSLTPQFLVLEALKARNDVRARVEVAGAADSSALASRLAQAAEGLQSIYKVSISGVDLTVRLGLGYAHLGLMHLPDESLRNLSAAACEAYVEAWTKQMFHLDPAAHIIRWEVLDATHKLLISAIDRSVYEALEHFSNEHGLRFVSCRAAVHAAIEDACKEGANRTVVWTEPNSVYARSPVVQLLRFQRGQLNASWRGWVPVSDDAQSDQLEAAVHRFQANQLADPSESPTAIYWPEVRQ